MVGLGMVKDNNERQRDYYQRKKLTGMKKVSVYVPAAMVERLRKYVAKLCK
jgi:hypothetical protein